MDKRSFNFLSALIAASMVIMVTYKVVKKKAHPSEVPLQHIKTIK
jgi:hypothetical protein